MGAGRNLWPSRADAESCSPDWRRADWLIALAVRPTVGLPNI